MSFPTFNNVLLQVCKRLPTNGGNLTKGTQDLSTIFPVSCESTIISKSKVKEKKKKDSKIK